MTGLRIALVNQTAGGGATLAANELLEWGPARGHEIRTYPGVDGGDPERLLAELAAFGPDIVHTHCWYGSYPYGMIERLDQQFTIVMTLHDVFPVNQYGVECWECFRNRYCIGCPALGTVRRWRPNYRIRDRLAKRRVNARLNAHLIFPSEWMRVRVARTELARLAGDVIPYGVDTERFHPGDEPRGPLGLPAGPIVLFAGNMYGPGDHRKGLPDLLRAWPAVRRAHPAASLVIAGAVTAESTPEGVVVLGERPRDALPALYRAAQVFCLPSHGDNLPVAALEALASGTPIVATNVGGIPEEVEDGGSGLLVPPASPEHLGNALIVLLRDENARERMGRRGRETAEQRFSRARSADLHDALYRRLRAERS